MISTRVRIAIVPIAVVLGLALSSGVAFAAGANPSNCPNPETRLTKEWWIGNALMRMELRYSAGCQAGWARLSRVAGNEGLGLSQSAWNPGGLSQYNVPNANYTYTVDAPRGRQVCGGFHARRWNGSTWYYAGWYYAGCYTAP